MTFTVRDYQDLLSLLNMHPEWREELRRAILSDDFLALPRIVRELAEAQRRTEEQVRELAVAQKRTEERLDELAEAQKRTEERLDVLAQRMDELAAAQKRTEEQLAILGRRVDELAEAQKQSEARLSNVEIRLENVETRLVKVENRLENVETRLVKVENKLSKIDGRVLESEYRNKVYGYFGRLMRRIHLVDLQTLEQVLEERLSPEQWNEVMRLDMLALGQLRSGPKAGQEAYLAVEISSVIDQHDVERVLLRAEYLRQAGLNCLPAAAGEEITKGAQTLSEKKGVICVLDGKMLFLEQALERW